MFEFASTQAFLETNSKSLPASTFTSVDVAGTDTDRTKAEDLSADSSFGTRRHHSLHSPSSTTRALIEDNVRPRRRKIVFSYRFKKGTKRQFELRTDWRGYGKRASEMAKKAVRSPLRNIADFFAHTLPASPQQRVGRSHRPHC